MVFFSLDILHLFIYEYIYISMFLFIIFIGGLKQPSLFILRVVYKHSLRQTFTIQGMILKVLDP